MLIDRWRPTANDREIASSCVKVVEANRYKARRFQFSGEVIDLIAEQMRENPMSLILNHQFARSPYDVCYIEFPIDRFYRTLKTPTTRDIMGDANADKTVGYLIVHNCVYVLYEGGLGGEKRGCSPVCYTIGPDAKPPELGPKGMFTLEFKDSSVDALHTAVKVIHMLGTTGQSNKVTMTEGLLESFETGYKIYFDSYVQSQVGKGDRLISRLMSHNVGEVRNILMLLLWLNQPKMVALEYVRSNRKLMKGRIVTSPEYHILRLAPGTTLQKADRVFAASGRKLRRHEVESFWRNHNRNDDCDHEWSLYPDIRGHFHCQKCSQFRVRVKQHERGDASLGYARKDYYVG